MTTLPATPATTPKSLEEARVLLAKANASPCECSGMSMFDCPQYRAKTAWKVRLHQNAEGLLEVLLEASK